MDAEERVLVALPQIHRARTERIAGPARHSKPALQCRHLGLKLRLPGDHLGGRVPIRPFLLALDRRRPRPAEAFASDADPITDGPAPVLDEIEIADARIDDDGAGLLGARVGDFLDEKSRIDLAEIDGRYGKRLAQHGSVVAGGRGVGGGCQGWFRRRRRRLSGRGSRHGLGAARRQRIKRDRDKPADEASTGAGRGIHSIGTHRIQHVNTRRSSARARPRAKHRYARAGVEVHQEQNWCRKWAKPRQKSFGAQHFHVGFF